MQGETGHIPPHDGSDAAVGIVHGVLLSCLMLALFAVYLTA